MRIIYINLDRSTDRRDWMEAQARRLGISFERLPAVDGIALKQNPFPDIPLGAAGCFLSHRAAWAKIAQGDDQFTLILEDDAHLSPDIPKFLTDESWIPEDTDLIHAELTQTFVTVSGRARNARGRKLVRTLGGGTGTGCYIISRACAARLTTDFTSIDTEFDQILFNASRPELTIYKLLPALSIQDKLTSNSRFDLTIAREPERKEEEEKRPRLKFGEKIVREAGRLKRQILAFRTAQTRLVRVKFK